MEIKELKTKVKIVFPEESEIFMAEEFLEALHGVTIGSKPVELDFSGVRTIDTVFVQLALGIIKSAGKNGTEIKLKSGEAFDTAVSLYGLDVEGMIGGEG